MNKYPIFRVLVGISLSPAVIACFFGIFAMVSAFEDHQNRLGFFGSVWFGIAFTFVAILVAEFLYFVPAFLLALIVVIFKSRKRLVNLFFISFLGGVFSVLWSGIVFSKNDIGLSVFFQDSIVSPKFFSSYFGVFSWGGISSFLMALWVLPKRSCVAQNDVGADGQKMK